MYRLSAMSNNLPLISINGVLGAALSPLDRGFAYGDGIFETCRCKNGVIPLWRYHLERLLQSADRLKIAVDEDLLTHYRDDLLAQADAQGITSAVLKITVTRGVGGRGYRMPDAPVSTYCLGLFACDPLQSQKYLEGVSTRICNLRLAQNPALAGMKHLNRLEQILARAEWQDEFAEGLLLDIEDRVVEGTLSNVFVVKGGQLYSPDLSLAGVAGVMRRVIIERIAPALGLSCQIKHFKLDFLSDADEIFLCNSVFGIWPVNRIVDDRKDQLVTHVFNQHRVTQALQQYINGLLS